VEEVYTQEELAIPRVSPWGTTTGSQKRGLEFSVEDYNELDKYCKSKPIGWFASPWDVKSASLMDLCGSQFIKIASPMLVNLQFLEICKVYGKPFILSTGMSTMEMVDDAIDVLGKDRIYAILHCTSTYPTDETEINLSCITTMKERYPWAKIGFSNHFPGIPFIVASAALGAEMIEFHITLDRSMYGSDQMSSLEPHAIMKIAKYIRGIELALGDGEKVVYDSEIPIIKKLRR
jgi:N-acetylneuraminate synthase